MDNNDNRNSNQNAIEYTRGAPYSQSEDDELERKIQAFEKYLKHPRTEHTPTATAADATAFSPLTSSLPIQSQQRQNAKQSVKHLDKAEQRETTASRFTREWISFTTDCFVYGLVAGAGYAFVNRNQLQLDALERVHVGKEAMTKSASSNNAKTKADLKSSATSSSPKFHGVVKMLTNRQRVSSLMLTYGTKFAFNALLFGAPFFCIDFALWKWQMDRDKHTIRAESDVTYWNLTDADKEDMAHRYWHRGVAGAFSGSLFGLIATYRDTMRSKASITGYSATAGVVVGLAYAFMQQSYALAGKRIRGGYTQDEIGAMKREIEEMQLQRSIRNVIDTEMEFTEKELSPEQIKEIQREYYVEREEYAQKERERMKRDKLLRQMEKDRHKQLQKQLEEYKSEAPKNE